MRNIIISRLRRSMKASGIEAMLVTSPDNRFYLSGFKVEDMGCAESAGALFLTADEKIVLTDGRYIEQAGHEASGWRVVEYKNGIASELAGLVRELHIEMMGFEPAFLSCHHFNMIQKAINIEPVPFGGRIERLRLIKDSSEIMLIRQAVKAVENVMGFSAEMIASGMQEKEIAWKILERIYHESDGPSFPPIVASGPNAALPHAVPGKRTVMPGDPVIIDIGCVVQGYCSDMTRTFFPGGAPSSEMRNIYRIVKDAQSKAQQTLMAGLSCMSVDRVARKIVADAGYGNRFIHGLGHGIGVAVHEAPALSWRNRKYLRDGMVVTVEPGIYLPGIGGVRLENMAIVRRDGADIINTDRWYYDF